MSPTLAARRERRHEGSMGASRTASVSGATGFVGRSVVRALLGRGWSVRALARDPAKARVALPTHDNLDVVQGDVLGPGVAAELMRGSSAAVNCIGIIRERPGGETFRRLHVQATRALCEAAAGGGVSRFVQISALGVHEEAATEYQRSKAEGERIVRASGLAWTILRPGLIHGQAGELTRQMRAWVTGRAAPFVFMPYFTRVVPGSSPLRPKFESARVQPVWVEDVARAVCDSLERPEAVGEVYNLTGPETVTWPEMLRFVREHVPDAKPGLRCVGLPAPIAAAKARALGAVGLGQLLPFDAGMALMAQEDSVARPHKARVHLGFEPVPFREAFAGYAGAM
ncbi:MAG: NAD(P)H-binding protein [Phycisphaerales bacterium]|nr:NAD(P)H-binding protein [Phycisphaerales bacterium]